MINMGVPLASRQDEAKCTREPSEFLEVLLTFTLAAALTFSPVLAVPLLRGQLMLNRATLEILALRDTSLSTQARHQLETQARSI
jgi:hypothetical protein